MLAELLDKLRVALGNRRHAYRVAFLSPAAQPALKDLARFCRAHSSTFHQDPRAHALAEGRREVWLRIQHHLQMSPDELWDLYDGRTDDVS